MVPGKTRKRPESNPVDQTTTSDRLAAYQKAWDAELPSNPGYAFIGIFVALFVFLMLASLPWIVSYLQDEGIIHPKIELDRPILPIPNGGYRQRMMQQFATPSPMQRRQRYQYQNQLNQVGGFGTPR